MSGAETVAVRAEDADQRLDRWLRRRFPGLTQGRIEKLLRTGQIRLDGKRVEARERVYAGQEVRLPPDLDAPPRPPPRAAVNERDAAFVRALVIHEDDDVIALDKPAGLAVQGGTGTARHLDGMLGALANEAGERPRLVHRLDRDTSGVLVLGRNARAAAKLAEAFRGRDTRKVYWALVAGVPKPARGRVDLALAKIAGAAGERVAASAEEGQRAITLYDTIDRAGDRAAWLALMPVTGRTHQLRVHCAEALRTPIVGDGKYGGGRSVLPAAGVAPLLHLHARALSIPHPAGGRLTLRAALPPHMRESWKFLGFEAGSAGDLELFQAPDR